MGLVPNSEKLRGFGEGPSLASSLVLDEEKRELVRSNLRRKGGGGRACDERAVMALKMHSEAERRRRERINGHLATLRSMVPCTDKLDKAALLAEVICHVKKLKSNATETSKGLSIPSASDEVRVEVVSDETNIESFLIKASLCCEDQPNLVADVRQTLHSLKLKTVQAEICTLGGRIKIVVLITCEGKPNDKEIRLSMTNVREALKSVLDRATSPEFVPRTTFGSKRQRLSSFESSCSSSWNLNCL